MDKVYCLKFYFNEYNQLGGYTRAIFREKPSFPNLKGGLQPMKNMLSLKV